MEPKARRSILFVCLMKLCHKIVESEFATQDPVHFRLWSNATEPELHLQNGTCYFDEQAYNSTQQSPATSWIFTSRYILPVLGGLVSSAWLGYIRALQLAGGVMLLATVLMSVIVYLGLMCQESSPLIVITWLLLPLFIGLAQPSILYGMFRWCRQSQICTIVSALYYITAVSGEWIALLMAGLSGANSMQSSSTLLFIALSVLFLQLSFFLPKELELEPFEMPTTSRMIKYFQIFSALILFLICVADTRPIMYTSEMRYYLNGTTYPETHSWISPKWLNLLTMLASCLLLILIAFFVSPYQLPVQPRMQAGILLEAAVAGGLIIFTAAASHGSTAATILAYSLASVLDGIAEVLVMVAAYDLAYQVAPGSSKSFVLGIVFAVWGLANFGSRLAIEAIQQLMKPAETGEKPQFYIYHLTTLLALIVCSIYQKFVALPLAQKLIPVDDEDSSSPTEETGLLSVTDA